MLAEQNVFLCKRCYVCLVLACVLTINMSIFKIGSTTIETTSPSLVSNISEDFSAAILVNNLFLVKSECASISLDNLSNMLKSNTFSSGQLPQGAPIFVWLFTKPQSDLFALLSSDVCGYLMVYQDEEGTRQYFAKRQGTESQFVVQQKQSFVVSNMFYDTDLLRGYHFACVSDSEIYLPEDTAIYGFISNSMSINQQFLTIDQKPIELYLDSQNNKGRLASVFFQGSQYDFGYLLNRNGQGIEGNERYETYCGQAIRLCPPDSSFEFCNGTNGTCHNGGSGCSFSSVIKAAKTLGLEDLVPNTLRNFYSFRDDFLGKSEKGKNYIRQWYSFSNNIRLIDSSDLTGSVSRITNYLSLAKSISTKLSCLLENGHNNEVILDGDTYNAVSLLISQHKGINPQLDTALAALSEDLKYLKGKSKLEVVTFFQP